MPTSRRATGVFAPALSAVGDAGSSVVRRGWRTVAAYLTAMMSIVRMYGSDASRSGATWPRACGISALSAVLIELPLAGLLPAITYRLLKLVAARRLGGSSAHSLWTLPAPMQDDSDDYLEKRCWP